MKTKTTIAKNPPIDTTRVLHPLHALLPTAAYSPRTRAGRFNARHNRRLAPPAPAASDATDATQVIEATAAINSTHPERSEGGKGDGTQPKAGQSETDCRRQPEGQARTGESKPAPSKRRTRREPTRPTDAISCAPPEEESAALMAPASSAPSRAPSARHAAPLAMTRLEALEKAASIPGVPAIPPVTDIPASHHSLAAPGHHEPLTPASTCTTRDQLPPFKIQNSEFKTPHPSRPPRTELANPHPKCIGIKVTPEAATITHYHYAEPRHYNLRMPRAQWDEIMRLVAEGHSDFIHNCDAHIAALHQLDAIPAA